MLLSYNSFTVLYKINIFFTAGTSPVTTVQPRQSPCGGKQTQTTEEQQTQHEGT